MSDILELQLVSIELMLLIEQKESLRSCGDGGGGGGGGAVGGAGRRRSRRGGKWKEIGLEKAEIRSCRLFLSWKDVFISL